MHAQDLSGINQKLSEENSFLKKRIRELEHSEAERKRAEEEIKRRDSKYQQLVEHAEDGIFTISVQGQFLFANAKFCQMLGCTNEECLRRNILDTYPDNISKAGIKRLADLQRGEALHFERPIKRLNGGGIIFVEARTWKDDDGNLQAIVRDITAQKQAVESLQKSEENFRRSLDDSPLGARIVSAQGETIYANQALLDIYGYTDIEELRSIPTKERYTSESYAEHLTRREKRQRGESVPYEYEICVFRKDGKMRRLQVFRKEILWNGAPQFQVLYNDITERKQAEEDLKKNKEMLRLITENMSDMIRVTDLHGNNLYLSPSHYKGLGHTPEERVGKSTFEVVHPDDVELIMNKFMEGHNSKQPVRVEYRVRHADGHYIWMETVADTLMDAQGKAISIVMSSRDISERKQVEEEKRNLEERLNRAEKMEAMGTLAGGVAHDLNNVLGVLVGYSELLLLNIPMDSPLRNHVEKMMKGGARAAAIVQDLLTLARRGVHSESIVNLNSIINDFQKTPEFENLRASYPKVRIQIKLAQDLMNIKGSALHISKTFMNLFINAVEAMPQGGTVAITTMNRNLDMPVHGYDEVRTGDYVTLSVSDTGEGILDEDIKHIFEPFYTKKAMGRSGTGLGLAVVWGTVKDHRGYIDVHSEKGKGTTLILYFPVIREALSKANAVTPLSDYMGKNESILVIDDLLEQRELASTILSLLNYRVSAAASGEEALEYLKSHQVDLIILDMIMDPGMDGLDTYRSILKIHPRQKAIIVSGFSETHRVKAAQELGAGDYLKKPYVVEKLGRAVRKELNKK